MSSETGFISDDVMHSFCSIQRDIESRLNQLLANHNYGDVISDLGIIPTMYPRSMLDAQIAEGRPVKERKLLRKGDVDYRLFIDHSAFVAGSEDQRKLLQLDNVIRVVQDLKRRVKNGFDGDALERDIRQEFGLPASGSML